MRLRVEHPAAQVDGFVRPEEQPQVLEGLRGPKGGHFVPQHRWHLVDVLQADIQLLVSRCALKILKRFELLILELFTFKTF